MVCHTRLLFFAVGTFSSSKEGPESVLGFLVVGPWSSVAGRFPSMPDLPPESILEFTNPLRTQLALKH